MKAVKLVGSKILELVDEPEPAEPGNGEVLIQVKAVGICGSDLHMYGTGAIGTTKIESPFILGHEFMGEVLEAGEGIESGLGTPLIRGQRVAVEPAIPCYRCELCNAGHPNLCPNHSFFGVYPKDGALCEKMVVPARNCFPLPDSISDGGGTLLETLGVAIHTLDLAKLKAARSVAIIGCGPVGLLILRLAVLAGASAVYAFDRFPWRTELARKWGATHAWTVENSEGVEKLMAETNGRGVDVAIEAAWANTSIDQAMEMVAYGGRVVLVGIPPDDQAEFTHSTARRKGLTIMMVRRMKHTYPRAIHLASGPTPAVLVDDLISEYVPLEETSAAFARNYAYESEVKKIIIRAG
ncbi:MAG: alcohol dehydrogenase catalytic domain-containing protein [Verrucomicrobia bacterium]|nr:alcohol dehydrogenase catalytic domain-containing protein [Verrucomicrobiota bacterium]